MKTISSVFVLTFLSLAVTAEAQELTARKASDLVTLTTGGGSSCSAGGTTLETRLLPDATSTPFTIPEGQVLVLTGVDWVITGAAANRATAIFLSLRPDPALPVSSVFVTGAPSDAGGSSVGSAAIPEIAVKSGVVRCLLLPGMNSRGFVHGYLARDR